MKRLVIGWMYPDHLNLYGDRGNIECLLERALWRDIDAEVKEISPGSKKSAAQSFSGINILFMGGGPDLSQKVIYSDFLSNKGEMVRSYIEKGGVALFICGGYQLLGNYYKPFEGRSIPGLGVLDMYTKHFGRDAQRCVGNWVFKVPGIGKVVGFENHGGRTYLGKNTAPLGRVILGCGNNGEDGTEGALYKNTYGTYSHGPLLPKNPLLSDTLLSKALNKKLTPLEDKFENLAREAALKLKG